MVVAFGVWSANLPSRKEENFVPLADLRITNAALGNYDLDSHRRRTSITLIYKDEEGEEKEAIICSLVCEQIEQYRLDLVIPRGQEFRLKNGPLPVSLTGNYIDQSDGRFDGVSSDSDEGSFDLDEVSSDVAVDMDELDGMGSDASRFEELVEDETHPKSAKRARDSDTAETDKKLTKAEKRKLKKLKAEGGQAVAAPANAAAITSKANKEQATKDPSTTGEDKKSASKDALATKEPHTEKKKAGGEGKSSLPKEAAVTKELSGGVKYLDSKVGTGPRAKNGDTVTMRYIGKFQNGHIFDQNTKGKPFTFHLGKGEVIKGWDVGIAGMQVGGERLLTIPPNMGYGKKANKDIPPNSTLIFECKLLEIK